MERIINPEYKRWHMIKEWLNNHRKTASFAVGASIGTILYFSVFWVEDTIFNVFFDYIIFRPFCVLTKSSMGEGCAMAYLFGGLPIMFLLFGLIGLLSYYIYSKVKFQTDSKLSNG